MDSPRARVIPFPNSIKRRKAFWRAAIFSLLAGAAAFLVYDQLAGDTSRVGEFLNSFKEKPAGEMAWTSWLPEDVEPSPLPPGAALVRDDGGAIVTVVIYMTMTHVEELTPAFTDLLKKMPVDVEFQVVCADEPSRERFKTTWGEAEESRGRRLLYLLADRDLTMWARDRHLAVQGPFGRTRVSLVPKVKSTGHKNMVEEMAVPRLRYAAGLVDRLGFLPFYLEGGNIVSNGRHVFIGNNAIEENAEVATQSELTEELSALFGRDVIFVHGRLGGVPFDHLDMYFTAVDERTVLVADLEQGAELIGSQTGRSPLASVRVDALKQRQLRDVCRNLEALGYTVGRLPAVMHSHKMWLLTYNNAIMERRNGEKIVYLPSYNLSQLDKAAAGVFRDLGFRVETIDASKLFRLGGAVRCVANVMLREPLKFGPRTTSAETAPQRTASAN